MARKARHRISYGIKGELRVLPAAQSTDSHVQFSRLPTLLEDTGWESMASQSIQIPPFCEFTLGIITDIIDDFSEGIPVEETD